MQQPTDTEFQLLREFLSRRTGIEVSEPKRYLFATRLADLLVAEKCQSFSDLLLKIGSGDEAVERATIEAMTTHESGFYRDPHHFETLFGTLLPALVERRVQGGDSKPIRLLSAGCGYGQEAYSMALGLQRWEEGGGGHGPGVSITGIDLSVRALERARKGTYTELELGPHLPEGDRARHFVFASEMWQLSTTIRDRVGFQAVNLTKSLAGLGSFDVIFCRNVIIYFAPPDKLAVLEQLRGVLAPQGALFLGSSESMYGIDVEFVPRTRGRSTYYERPSQARPP